MEGDGGAHDRFSLTLPARAGLVGTLRVFASSVARHYELDDDVVEDVKLAVSEACTDPIDAGVAGDLVLTIVGGTVGLDYTIASARWPAGAIAAAGDLPEGIDPAALDRLQVVRALFADAERSERDDVVLVRFTTGSRGSS
jgi:histidine kinase-like protein